MGFELHMQSTTAPTTALVGGCVCRTAASVGASGEGLTAAWNSALTSAQGMDSASLMDAGARRGKFNFFQFT